MLVMPGGVGKTHADIREILAQAAGTEEGRAVAQIVAGHRGTDAPTALDVGLRDACLADLLTVAGDTPFGRIDSLAGHRLTAVDGREGAAGVGIGHRGEAAQSKHGIGDQPEPGGQENQEDAAEQCR